MSGAGAVKRFQDFPADQDRFRAQNLDVDVFGGHIAEILMGHAGLEPATH